MDHARSSLNFKMNSENRQKVLGIYASLKGLERSWPRDVSKSIILERALALIRQGCTVLELEPNEFLPPQGLTWKGGSGECYFNPAEALPFVQQFLSYVEMVEQSGDRVQEVGSLFNVIKNEELKKRCSDLLSSPGPFDRAISQATLVLEDSIRKKVGDEDKLTGTNLAGKYIKSDPAESPVVISTDNSEQEGFSNMVKGVMLVFRNETHHQISDNFTREEALQVCGFIDNLISIIDRGQFYPDR